MKIKKVKLSDLKTTFFVRTQLDTDHVLKLADLYAAGEKMPLIRITSDNEVIDGRHRREAMELAHGRDYAIDVEVVPEKDDVTIMAMALTANEGGSLTPSRADVIYTIKQMLERGATEKKIMELLPYPKAVTRKYLGSAKTNLKKGLLQKAREDVANGMTVREASEKHGVEVADLKRAISPAVGVNQSNLTNMLSDIGKRSYAFNRTNQAMVKRMVVGFADGDVPERAVEQVLEKYSQVIDNQRGRLKDWRSRFEAARKGQLINWKDISPDSKETEEAA
jgi:ParB-like chromosome segregation protein Spo0J